MENISWKLIDRYFEDNPYNLVAHHLESYNDFYGKGIMNIFRENNPVRFIDNAKGDKGEGGLNECLFYLGGKNGDKIYYGKPIIYDDTNTHYMYPNDARLRNMTYGMTIHYDVEVEIIYYDDGVTNDPQQQQQQAKEPLNMKQTKTIVLEKMYLGRFPIMLHSHYCILSGLSREVRFNMGECRNDFGGYFIIDGKEKVVMCQEKFADNMLYVRQNKADDVYSFSAEIRSVSEDASKPIRTTAVKMMAPEATFSNNQIVVLVPNVRKPVPLFILMRALGVIADKSIIETCLLDLHSYNSYIDLFIPSIHDANTIFTQQLALEYIATFTKRETIDSVLDILMNYFLPHVGEKNFIDKAFFVGRMVLRLLKVSTKEDKPTDRDSFLFKRVELTGTLLYDLFREYFLAQKKELAQAVDKQYYFHTGTYQGAGLTGFASLIEDNVNEFFKVRTVETGFKRAFKGNWGSQPNTKRLGVVQDLSRLSWFTFISHLRKIILPLDASAKVVGPRHLNSSQWGYIDPVDTPDGGHIGLHKHLSISTFVTSGSSAKPLIAWLVAHLPLKRVAECSPAFLHVNTKVLVNGQWIGVVEEDAIYIVDILRLCRRNGLLPCFTSIRLDYLRREIVMYTDAGRLTRPIYYMTDKKKPSFSRPAVIEMFKKGEISWQQICAGLKVPKEFSIKDNRIYSFDELYRSSKEGEDLKATDWNTLKWLTENEKQFMEESQSVVDYIDTNEEESALIAFKMDDLPTNPRYTHVEIDPSLIFGVMGNSVIYPEHNQFPRNVFSCGQSRQAVSMYHSNYPVRIDKMGVVLNYGQTPLIKSRYLEKICKEEQPYGVNAIVAIMSYTGYNVEDAILINAGSIDRGIFSTTYYTMYESREESGPANKGRDEDEGVKKGGPVTMSIFTNVQKSAKKIEGFKSQCDYSFLDDYGIIQENTPLHDKIVLIGQLTSSSTEPNTATDDSVVPKKGQLGFVDKSFITEGEEGKKLAKIRVREIRLPAIGDKMASRAGQKGTLGLIIPEEDMPFAADGTRPDLIINPHALPSRMTIGQLVESVLGKICAHYGGFGDCTAFANKGSHAKEYGRNLTAAGYHSSGNQMLYNGYTGEAVQADIYIGPTYYMRLKHMVKDKINYRARGPRTALTRQTVQGRANDGGLRIGEMERDGILAHGASGFLNESFMVRGDEYTMAVCNKTGCAAIYNPAKNLFLSPLADGPIQFSTTHDGALNLENISRFGRSFSLVRVPYALKLLMQELTVLNVQMRIITEENVDQLMPMSFSENAIHLAKDAVGWKPYEKGNEKEKDNEKELVGLFHLKTFMRDYNRHVSELVQGKAKPRLNINPDGNKGPFVPGAEEDSWIRANRDILYGAPPTTPDISGPRFNPDSVPYAPSSPGYSPVYVPGEEQQQQQQQPSSPDMLPPLQGTETQTRPDFGNPDANQFFDRLSPASRSQILSLRNPRDQRMILQKIMEKQSMKESLKAELRQEQQEKQGPTSVLSTEEKSSLKEAGITQPNDIKNENPLEPPKEASKTEEEKEEEKESNQAGGGGSSSEGTKKTIRFTT